MESANLDLEENKEIADNLVKKMIKAAQVRDAARKALLRIHLKAFMLTLITFMKKEDLTKLNSFLNFSVFMISKIITI